MYVSTSTNFGEHTHKCTHTYRDSDIKIGEYTHTLHT